MTAPVHRALSEWKLLWPGALLEQTREPRDPGEGRRPHDYRPRSNPCAALRAASSRTADGRETGWASGPTT